MTTFGDSRQQLAQAREAREQALDGYAASRATLRELENEVAQAERTDPGGRVDEGLEGRLTQAQTAAQRAKDKLERHVSAEQAAFERFAEFSDPRRQIGELSDELPILLFPVRLETRFKESGGRHELWVRGFADTCMIDTFEPELSAAELRSGRSYWQEVRRAGGEDDGRRAAWRNLVASHGAGRAEWIVDHFQPETAEGPPKGANEVVLVIGTDAPPGEADAEALTTYWEAAWRAGSGAAAQKAAREAFDLAVGAPRAEELLAEYKPFNFKDGPPHPLQRSEAEPSVVFLVFPQRTPAPSSWTRAPQVDLLPERFLLLATAGSETVEQLGEPVASPLYVGPDPSASPHDSIRVEEGKLIVPDELKWLVDFDTAVERGMGFKVPLSEAQAQRGFDRLMVLGLRLGADATQAQEQLEELFEHHRNGRSGLSLVPQGTPTNNTEAQSAGYSRREDADASYEDLTRGDLFTPTDEWLTKADGQRLAEALGVDFSTLARVRESGGADQQDAQAMNVALWPATLGYFLETMMHPVFSEETVGEVRSFFTRYVTGRGALPAFRVGSQPYGILPTTAFSRIGWTGAERRHGDAFLDGLYRALRHCQGEWSTLARSVSHVSAHGGDVHQALLDILGLHPASAEFHSRFAQSVDQIYNHLNASGGTNELLPIIEDAGFGGGAMALLESFGYSGERPDLLYLIFQQQQALLDGGLVDDVPLSETKGIREWTADHRNYLEWLADTGRSSLDDLRRQRGFKDERPPGALLYLLARQALMLGYHDAGWQLYRSAGVLEGERLRALKAEPKFIHIDEKAEASESRWALLYEPQAQIAPDGRPLWEYIGTLLPEAEEARLLREQLEALDLLKDASTGRLERAFAEHLDCCGYRLDAWMLGLVRLQLERMRWRAPKGGPPTRAEKPGRETLQQGIYLGAYGWLEDVRPKAAKLEPVELPDELAKDFEAQGEPPLVRDSSNGGFVHAPSLDHATTAAVLRSGFLAHASEESPDTLSVNLSSRRVRLALNLLDGIRSGQSLGALLGYRLERGLHDRHGEVEVDSYIYALRKQFPLRADKIAATATEADTPIEAVEARNVVDGLRLVEHVRETGDSAYPFGVSTLPEAGEAERAAIDAEVDALVDVYDAVADLALAEGVHQASRGNYDRVSATLDSYTKGHFPPEPEVVQTPTTGTGLTHRVGLHLDPAATAPAGATPRALAEPALNDWLGAMLPPLDRIFCQVEWRDPVSAHPQHATVKLDALGLQPVDLLYLVRSEEEHAMGELDDRVLRQVLGSEKPRPDAELTIRYLVRQAGEVSVFELEPLVRALRSLVLGSRPLRASDVALPNESSRADDQSVSGERGGLDTALSGLTEVRGELTGLAAELAPLLEDQPNRRGDVVAEIDGFIDRAVPALAAAAAYGMKQGGFGFALDWRRKMYGALIERVRERVERMDGKLNELHGALADYATLPSDTPEVELFSRLQGAEAKIRSASSPLPHEPAELLSTVEGERPQFEAKREALEGIVSGSVATVSGLFAAIEATAAAALPLADLDQQPFSLEDLAEQTVAFAGELLAAVESAAEEAGRRAKAAADLLTEYEAAAAGPLKFETLEAAAKELLGDDFRLLPRFELAAGRGAEWKNALDASTGGELLAHLEGELEILEPVDEWLAGVAPVRKQMRAWQQAALQSGMFGLAEPELTPIQLPYRSEDSWLALQFPADYKLDGDRVLYTAHYRSGFAPGAAQCGLLIDEWTEVIPGDSHQTGVAFNFDRPSSEPPQSLLLVTPAAWGSGSWSWIDLVEAVVETFELAKLRAVEPEQIGETPYASYFPSLIMAATLRGLAIGTILADNDRVMEAIDDHA